jgi:integral membrane protein
MIETSTPHSNQNAGKLAASSTLQPAAKWLRTVGTIEAVSFLLLLLVAMPLKYAGGNASMVHVLGPIHGGLFLLYVGSAVAVTAMMKWPWYYVLLALVSSVVPFGPFLFEAWLRRRSNPVA